MQVSVADRNVASCNYQISEAKLIFLTLITLICKYQLLTESVVSCNYQISEAKLIFLTLITLICKYQLLTESVVSCNYQISEAKLIFFNIDYIDMQVSVADRKCCIM